MSELTALRRPAFGVTADHTQAVARFRADLARLCDADAGRLLVAVSGGADSLALLLLAHAATGGSLHAATVNHGLRKESAAEADFVAAVCRQLGVPHAVLTGTLPQRVGRTANVSARARELRYGLLEEHRLSAGAALIATAHHADDQVETMAMRLNRGAGVAGLAGIRAVTGRVVRPLLDWRRSELMELVSAAGLRPVADPSNVDDRFDRARMRKALAGADWLDVGRWARSAATLADAEDALAWAARRACEGRISESEGGVTLWLEGEPQEIVRRLVTECLLRVDAQADPRGSDVARLVEGLRTVQVSSVPIRMTLGGVMVMSRNVDGGRIFDFTPAPPRRHVAA